MIDGININDIESHSLRKYIGVVSQDTFIFKGTIEDNIKYGKKNATEYEVIEACKKAGLYKFIKTLPNGLNTDVGPKGLKLSGGQKQRIAIARVILMNPEIILLDEATSALDNESERIVQKALKHFSDKTIISVAHRLTTIQNSDKIVVLDNHTISEYGTHEELMSYDSIYKKLYEKKDDDEETTD
jgi:ATP-binding cassette subfamily B protein/subfamily B ATP-binding cassette protein MsbA